MARVALTDKFVLHAKADGSGRADYFDAKTPGLVLRVSGGGKRTWSFFYTSPKDGKRARLTLGTYPARSLSSARALALEAKSHVGDNMDPRDLYAAQDASAVTVKTLWDAYLEKHVRPNLRSASFFEHRINKKVVPVIGSIRLADLHPRDINLVLDPIIKRKKPTEANRVFENMRAMFRWAVKRGDLDRSPMDAMGKPAPEPQPRERALSEAEIHQLWSILPDALPRSLACQRIIRLCLVTGQRVGEVAGMSKEELDLDKKLWSLPGTRTKNGNPHTVPLSPLALGIIQDAIRDAGDESRFLFPSPPRADAFQVSNQAIHPHAVATTLRRAHQPNTDCPRGRFGMIPWRVHDLRRTVLTGLAELSIAPIVIGSVANHLSVTKATVTFAHYVRHDYAAEKRRALELWADRLEAITAGRTAQILKFAGIQ